MDGVILDYYGGLIPMLKKEEDFLKGYINDLLEKEYIRLSKLLILYEVLFILKKDRSLRLYIDYR